VLLCTNHAETTFHLFFECSFAFKLRCWFATILDTPLQFQSITDIWSTCDRGWSPQCKVVIQATTVNQGCQWVSAGTGSMISVPAPLDKYGTRIRPHIRAGISIRVIHGYLDTHRYLRVPMDF